MNSVVVITVGLPRMLQEIITDAIETHSHIVLEANLADFGELHDLDSANRPDYLVVQDGGADFGNLLREFSPCKIVSIEANGKDFYLWELRPHRSAIGSFRPGELVEYMIDHQLGRT